MSWRCPSVLVRIAWMASFHGSPKWEAAWLVFCSSTGNILKGPGGGRIVISWHKFIYICKFEKKEKIEEGVSGQCHHSHYYHRILPHLFEHVVKTNAFPDDFLNSDRWVLFSGKVFYHCISESYLKSSRLWEYHPLEYMINYFHVSKWLRQVTCKTGFV